MISHNTTQHFATHPHGHSLENAIGYLQSTEALSSRHWICSGCGAAHERKLPEECESCGATALEFEYSTFAETEIRH